MRLLTARQCLAHEPGPNHPESPGRLNAVLQRLTRDLPQLVHEQASPATDQQLARVHDDELISQLAALSPAAGVAQVDADTLMSAGSLDAARYAAGAVVEAVESVLSGAQQRVFCAVRPPGHHAESARAMGFCLFNSVAVGAAHALADGLERVSVVDFDVHHGNGTQQIFASEPRVQYLSSHQMPLYPGTGDARETGVGNVVNVPLAAGSGSQEFRAAWSATLLPALEAFAPQLILVSAGFDAHASDPLAGLAVLTDDFGWLTGQLMTLADRHCEGRIVSSLEGGYDLAALAECVSAHVSQMLHHRPASGAG